MKQKPTDDQKEAFSTLDQSMVLGAGAGAGKTEVLTRRVIKILEREEFPSVLAITFTKKASAEMRSRIYKEVSSDKNLVKKLSGVKIQTIDSLCSDLVREYAPYLKVSPNFKVMEEGQSIWHLQRVISKEVRQAYKMDTNFQKLLGEWKYEFSQIEFQILALYTKLRQNGQVKDFDFKNHDLTEEEKSYILSEISEILVYFEEQYQSKRTNFQRILKSSRGQDYLAQRGTEAERLEFLKDLSQEIGKIKYGQEKKEEFQGLLQMLNKDREKENQEYISSIKRLLVSIDQTFWEEKRESGLMDFGDLLEKALDLINIPSVQTEISRIYNYVLVDEFQDTNEMQIQLISILAKEANLFVVGDRKQSIYGFRGSNVESSLDAGREMEKRGAKRLQLKENFRSTPDLMNYINSFFDGKIKDYQPLEGKNDDKVSEFGLVNLLEKEENNRDEGVKREAEFIVAKAKSLWREDPDRTMGLLVRTRSKMNIYEEVFRENHLPFINRNSRGFFETREIQDLLLALQYLLTPHDRVSYIGFLRSPFVGLKESSIYKILHSQDFSFSFEEKKMFAKVQKFYDSLKEEISTRGVYSLIYKILYDKSYLSYVENFGSGQQGIHNLFKFLEMSRCYDQEEARGLAGFIEWIERKKQFEDVSQADIPSSRSCLEISTIHASKGLQYNVVFIGDISGGGRNDSNRFNYSREFGAGINFDSADYVFQENKKISEIFEEEENLRLFYVAMTRAKSHLYILKSCESKNGFMPYLEGKEEWDFEQGKMIDTDHGLKQIEKEVGKRPPLLLKQIKKPLHSPSKLLQKEREEFSTNLENRPKSQADQVGSFLHQYAAHAYRKNRELKESIISVARTILDNKDVKRLDHLIDKYDQSLDLGEEILATEIPFLVEFENFQLQGVFDQVRKIDGKLHLIDLKTGRTGSKTPYLDKYRMQLKLYGKSWEKVYGSKPVLEIFFLQDGKKIEVEPMSKEEEDLLVKDPSFTNIQVK